MVQHTTSPTATFSGRIRPDEKTFRCTVSTLAQTAKENQITKTALILVGDFLGSEYERSKLYDPSFTTEFREATK